MVVGLSANFYASLKDLAFTLSDIQWVERVPNLNDALVALERLSPQILLVEIPQGNGNDILLLKRALLDNPHIRIIAVAPREDAQLLLQAAYLGASALVKQDIPLEFLISTARRVVQGEEPIEYSLVSNPKFASEVIRFLRGANSALEMNRLPCPLSQQQRRVLTAAARGLTNVQIAATLGLQGQTIKNYMTTIMRKIDARDRVQAVVFALKNGWIDLEEPLP